jgi:rhodanese-related sulfurtransferase
MSDIFAAHFAPRHSSELAQQLGEDYVEATVFCAEFIRKENAMASVLKATVEEVQSKLKSGSGLLLVCAYDSDEKFRENHLDGALSFNQFKAMEATLPKDREIVFYCHWPNEASSARVAEQYQQKGFTNVKALQGGVEEWQTAGYALVWCWCCFSHAVDIDGKKLHPSY